MSEPTTPMDRALELARGVMGTTSPNPPVGCVIVKQGVIVGEGATRPPPGLHAERVALAEAGERARGSAVYVSLEPHAHQGRTPPCTDALIEAGVAEAHVATLDRNPETDGRGVSRLEAAGIRVIVGEGEAEARLLYEAFFKWVTTGAPFVYAKFAMSLDGKIATRAGDSRWITGPEARAEAHRLRGAVDAVMVGANTVRLDDPQLTARDREGRPCRRQPLRVVVDSKGSTRPGARLFREPGATLVATTAGAAPEAVAGLQALGADVRAFDSSGDLVDVAALLTELGRREVTSVLVEGGGTLLASLFEARLVDKVHAFVAPVIIGGREAPSPVQGLGIERIAEAMRLRDVEVARFGDDVLVSGYVES